MKLTHIAARAGRLSSFLREEMAMSAGLVNRLKWHEKILVNGVPQHTDYPVQPGDEITALLDDPIIEYPAEQGDLTVLYEDAHILAVDKPAGMLIHPSRSRNSGTLANYVMGYYEKTGQHCAFHPLTRLDRDTFGVVLLAKNGHINALLQAGDLQKTYHAVVFGGPAENRGIIDAPIARKPLPSLLREVRPDGKLSVTEYRVLERDGELCKLELRPITGRTHQLRVHCAHKGFPIVGDPQYGNAESMAYSKENGVETQLLCAKKLEFTHPVTGESMLILSQMDVSLTIRR
ncbi:MAG: RluA family pseudouridine synthase [Ruminococcaceae bacterium]|nr:RluA family pseudouridine synthase [Oscillospiraceae bacterium]